MKVNKQKLKVVEKENVPPAGHKVTFANFAFPFVEFLGRVLANAIVVLIMLTVTVIFGRASHWVLTFFDAMHYAELFEKFDTIVMWLEYIYFVLTVISELLEYIVLAYNRITKLLKNR